MDEYNLMSKWRIPKEVAVSNLFWDQEREKLFCEGFQQTFFYQGDQQENYQEGTH